MERNKYINQTCLGALHGAHGYLLWVFIALAVMQGMAAGVEACIIGQATAAHPGTVVMKTVFGGGRIVDMLVGEQLPRIC